jgi:hypothetical protein
VDFNDPNRPRRLKASGAYYKSIIANHGFVKYPSCPYYDVSSIDVAAENNEIPQEDIRLNEVVVGAESANVLPVVPADEFIHLTAPNDNNNIDNLVISET